MLYWLYLGASQIMWVKTLLYSLLKLFWHNSAGIPHTVCFFTTLSIYLFSFCEVLVELLCLMKKFVFCSFFFFSFFSWCKRVCFPHLVMYPWSLFLQLLLQKSTCTHVVEVTLSDIYRNSFSHSNRNLSHPLSCSIPKPDFAFHP